MISLPLFSFAGSGGKKLEGEIQEESVTLLTFWAFLSKLICGIEQKVLWRRKETGRGWS